MARAERYGIPADDIDAVADRLGRDLALDFERRESSFWGDYCLHDAGGVFEIPIYYNDDPQHDPLSGPPHDQYFEPDYRKLRILMDACLGRNQLDDLREALVAAFPGAVLIRADGDH